MLLSAPVVAQTDELELSGPSATVREGYFTLSVETARDDSTASLVVERSNTENFSSVTHQYPFLGSSTSMTLSGFADGEYWFRVSASESAGTPSSPAIRVQVQHYPLWQALSLFAIGAALFLVVLVYILRAALSRGGHE